MTNGLSNFYILQSKKYMYIIYCYIIYNILYIILCNKQHIVILYMYYSNIYIYRESLWVKKLKGGETKLYS